MKLWFEDVNYNERLISTEVNNWQDVNTAIDNFISDCNRKWPKKVPFKRYYTRVWQQEDGRTRIDVGSHSEFFIWEGKYDSESGSKNI